MIFKGVVGIRKIELKVLILQSIWVRIKKVVLLFNNKRVLIPLNSPIAQTKKWIFLKKIAPCITQGYKTRINSYSSKKVKM